MNVALKTPPKSNYWAQLATSSMAVKPYLDTK